jgi:sugar phosphate isomerase/epimerase
MPNTTTQRDLVTRLSRREFLAGVGGATLVTALSPVVGLGAENRGDAARWKMKLSTSTVQFSSLSIEETCRRIAALGFTGVDIWSAYQGCPHLDDCLNRLGPDGLIELLKRTRLDLTAFSTYVGGFAKYAQLLGQVGGGVAIRGSTGPCAPKELSVRMAQFLDELKPLVELAEQTKSFLAIENHGNALLDSLDSFKAFTDLNESPRLGLALAPYHLQAIGASVPEAIRISGKQLLFFYAWQKGPGLMQLPGIGSTDLTPWLRALAQIRYEGYVNAFMHNHPNPTEMSKALTQSKAKLEACYQGK